MAENIPQADIPQGFSRALQQNIYAQQYFSSLTDNARLDIINRAAQIISEEEMHSFVNGLVKH